MECPLSISGSSCLPCHHHASVQLVPKYIKSESHHYQSTIPKDLSVINIWVLLPPSQHHASVQLVRKYIKSESESHPYQFTIPKNLSVVNIWVLLPPLSPPSFSSVQLVPKYRSKLEVMFIIVIPKDFIASIKGFLERKIPPIIWKVWRALRL